MWEGKCIATNILRLKCKISLSAWKSFRRAVLHIGKFVTRISEDFYSQWWPCIQLKPLTITEGNKVISYTNNSGLSLLCLVVNFLSQFRKFSICWVEFYPPNPLVTPYRVRLIASSTPASAQEKPKKSDFLKRSRSEVVVKHAPAVLCGWVEEHDTQHRYRSGEGRNSVATSGAAGGGAPL